MPCRDPGDGLEQNEAWERRQMLAQCLCYLCRRVEAEGLDTWITDHPELLLFWTEHKATDGSGHLEPKFGYAGEERRRERAIEKVRQVLTPSELRALRGPRTWIPFVRDSLDGITSACEDGPDYGW